MLKFGFQDHSSGSENDRKDSASQPSSQSDTGKQGLGPLGNPITVHAAVKVGTDHPPSTCLTARSMSQLGAELSSLGVVVQWESGGRVTQPTGSIASQERRKAPCMYADQESVNLCRHGHGSFLQKRNPCACISLELQLSPCVPDIKDFIRSA